MKTRTMAILPLTLAALLMAGCSGGEKAADDAQNATTAKNGAASEEGGHADEEGEIDLSAGQIRKAGRSEEHTSELQSLMRISYAVFCLKKKTQEKHIQD